MIDKYKHNYYLLKCNSYFVSLLTGEMEQMDDLDLKIAKMHEKQTYISSRDIARQLGISASTVRRRMSRMFESGEIESRMMVDIDAFPGLYITLIGINLTMSPEKCISKVFEIPSVLFVENVTGKYGLLALLIHTSRKMLLNTTRQLIKIEGVSTLETFVVMENHGLRVSASKLSELFEMQKNTKNV